MAKSTTALDTDRPARRRRSDGERSRQAILREAGQLATVDGIAGLSIARLADAVGMSKSGLFAHFGSKEELQLATIETAYDLFKADVIDPAAAAPRGVERLRQLTGNYLTHVSTAYPGGCFFASIQAEMDTHEGPVRDRLVAFTEEWLGLLETAVRDAQAEGAIDPSEDATQLVFELEAFLFLGNAQLVVSPESAPIERARRSLELRIAAALAPPARAARRSRHAAA